MKQNGGCQNANEEGEEFNANLQQIDRALK
jgi:hypothetical protein